MVNKLTIIVNVILYAFLVAIILVFHFSPATTSRSCGYRVPATVDDSVRKGVAIAYAVLIAFVSLLIGSAFLIFGGKLQLRMRSTAKALGRSTGTSKVCHTSDSISDTLDLLAIISQFYWLFASLCLYCDIDKSITSSDHLHFCWARGYRNNSFLIHPADAI
jgi:hypothetical protein